MIKTNLDQLLGSLVLARDLEPNTEYSAIGRYNDLPIVVNHAQRYAMRECLVKIDSNPISHGTNIIGNFVTSQIPAEFLGLSYSQYILFALWEERMKKEKRFPTIEEVNQYFDPGNIVHTYFLSQEHRKDRRNRVLIYHRGYSASKISTKKMIETLTRRRRTRIIIAESEVLMRPIVDYVKNMGLVPITMEPLS